MTQDFEADVESIPVEALAALRELDIRELRETIERLGNPFGPSDPPTDFRSTLSYRITKLEKILKTVECLEDMIAYLRRAREAVIDSRLLVTHYDPVRLNAGHNPCPQASDQLSSASQPSPSIAYY